MNIVNELHKQAMDFASDAYVGEMFKPGAPLYQPPETIKQLNHWALIFEREAALRVEVGEEPTRGILHRSAATLAVHAGQYEEARRIANAGLAGNPPDWLKDELEEVFERLEKGTWRSERTN